MLNYIKKEVGILDSNAYFVYNDKRECVLIDCGGNYSEMKNILEENNLNLVAILLTHGHYDHIAGISDFRKEGIKVYIHEKDLDMLSDTKKNLGEHMGLFLEPTTADVILKGDEELNIAGFNIKVLHTPGHTQGGVSYLFNNEVVFTGDTLFSGSIGRTDFENGSYEDILKSIKEKIFVLDDEIEVCPGHMSSSTIQREKDTNPYFK